MKTAPRRPRTIQERRDIARRRVRRERQVAAGVTLGCVVVVGAFFALSQGGSATGTSDVGHGSAKAAPPPQEPRGGRTLLPDYRVVAYYGAPQDPGLGQLGIGTPHSATAKLLTQAAPYARPGRPVMPALELIATLVTAAAGDDGKYRYRQSSDLINRYLAEARRAKALLILDIQPGRARFMDEVRAYQPYLREPDVGLALDPEWSMRRHQIPGQVIGSTTASIVNQAGAYLAALVKRYDLPQKLLIVHQFTSGMIQHRRTLVEHPGVALVINIDGFGNPANKISKYDLFAKRHPPWYNGFKLFYHEDTHMMSPRAVMRLHPRPNVVIYE